MNKENTETVEQVDIKLPEPITINGTDVSDFQFVREPTGNDLGRHTFINLLDGDVKALMHVTPKIVQPYLSPRVIKEMPSKNLAALAMGYNAFFEGVDMDNMATPSSQTSKKSTPANSSSSQKAD